MEADNNEEAADARTLGVGVPKTPSATNTKRDPRHGRDGAPSDPFPNRQDRHAAGNRAFLPLESIFWSADIE